MITAIGLRVAGKSIFYTVLTRSDSASIPIMHVVSDKLDVPGRVPAPERLKLVRNSVAELMSRYEVSQAGIYFPEPSRRSFNVLRFHMEGVMQEVAACCTQRCFAGALDTVCAYLQLKRKEAIRSLEGDKAPDEVTPEQWAAYRREIRESYLMALAALQLLE